MFKKEAQKIGILPSYPQRQFQHDYFNNFIKPQQDYISQGPISANHDSRLARTIPKSVTDRRHKLVTDPSRESFIPMNDLLKRNHKDRVQDYLSQMDDTPDELLTSAVGI